MSSFFKSMLKDKLKLSHLFFTIFLLFTACSQKKLTINDIGEYSDLSEAQAKQYAAQLNTQSDRINNFRSLIKATISDGTFSKEVDQIVVFKRPDKLRVEMIATALNRLAVLVTTDGEDLSAYDAQEGELYVGKANAVNLEQLLSIPFAPEELMLWYLGQFHEKSWGVPATSINLKQRAEQESTGSFEDDAKNKTQPNFVLEYHYPQGRLMRVYFSRIKIKEEGKSRDFLLIKNIEIYREENSITPLFQSSYEYHAKQNQSAYNVPNKINFWFVQHNVFGEMVYERQIINSVGETIPNKLFSIKPMLNVKQINLDKLNAEYGQVCPYLSIGRK